MRRRKLKSDRSPQSRGRRRRLRVGCGTLSLLVLVAAGALVFFGPAIVARTSLLQQVVPWAVPAFQGRVSIGSASLGWLKPITVRDVTAVDRNGQPLFAARTIQSEKSLFSLVAERSRLGQFRVDRPHLTLRLRDDGSNLEDALAPLLAPTGTPARGAQFSVAIFQGSAEIDDTVSGVKWNVTRLNASAQVPGPGEPIRVELAGRIRRAGRPASQLDAALSWLPAAASNSSGWGSGQLHVQSARLPLKLLQPALRRFLPGSRIDGSLTSDTQYIWDGEKHSLEIAKLTARQIQFDAPAWLGSDRLQTELLTARGTIAIEGNQITARRLEVHSDLFNLQADGTLPTARRARQLLLAALQQQDYRVSGEVDVARLARMLPRTLHIREGLRVTSGKLSAALSSALENGRRRWVGSLQTASLTAVHHGRPIRWEQPIRFSFSAARSSDGLVIERLACDSNFLQLSGRGTWAGGSASARGDLNRLAAELAQFVDCRTVRLAGQLTADVRWQRDADGRLAAHAEASVENFELAAPGRRPWREPRLTLALDAAGRADARGVHRIDRAVVRVQSGDDLLQAELAEPVAEVTSHTALPVRCRLDGDLATWLPRIQSWAPLKGWQLGGDVSLVASGLAGAKKFVVQSSEATIKQFRARSAGLAISEPEVRAEVAAAWDFERRMLTSKQSTFASSTLSLRTSNLVADVSGDIPKLSGDVAFRADLNRLMSWTSAPSDPPAVHLFGMLVGRANLSHSGGVTLVDGSGQIERFALARKLPAAASGSARASAAGAGPWKAIWYEKQLKIQGNGDYSHVSGELHLANFQLATAALQVTANGKLSDLGSRSRVDLSGVLDYDLGAVAAQLRPSVSRDLQIVGRDRRPFFIRGPLRSEKGPLARGVPASQPIRSVGTGWPPPELSAQAEVAWSSASAEGFTIGEGQLQARLARGAVEIQPLDLPISGGRLKLAPKVLLGEEPPVLVLDRGPILQQIHLSPDMCRMWLKYVAPLLADATRAEGHISVDLAGARLPLSHPTSGTMRGTLHVHDARVGPGPVGQQLLLLADEVLTIVDRGAAPRLAAGASQRWISLPEQNVDFYLADGRVYHEGLELVVGNVPIRTQGSVGLDQTLLLVAEFPIGRQSSVGHLLPGLEGRVLRVPIRGSLSRPQVDDRAVADLARQIIGGSVEKLLKDELIKGLEGLMNRAK